MGFDFKRAIKREKNVGEKDQQIRYVAGCVSIGIAVFTGSIILLLLGCILLGSAFLTWCPVCSGLNINTCKK